MASSDDPFRLTEAVEAFPVRSRFVVVIPELVILEARGGLAEREEDGRVRTQRADLDVLIVGVEGEGFHGC